MQHGWNTCNFLQRKDLPVVGVMLSQAPPSRLTGRNRVLRNRKRSAFCEVRGLE